MYTVLNILSGTPWWVYVLFVYLIVIGISALQPHTVSLYKLAMAPIIFIVWSLYSFHGKYGFSFSTLSLWSLALLIGIFIGWIVFSYHAIKVSKTNMLVHLPGSWIPLFFYLAFFMLKYCIGVIYALSPEMRINILFWLTDVIVSGVFSGIFAGRFLHIAKQYYRE